MSTEASSERAQSEISETTVVTEFTVGTEGALTDRTTEHNRQLITTRPRALVLASGRECNIV